MSGITLIEAQTILAALLAARLKVAQGYMQSMQIRDRSVTFKDGAAIDKEIVNWQNIVAQLQRAAAGGRSFGRSRAVFGCN